MVTTRKAYTIGLGSVGVLILAAALNSAAAIDNSMQVAADVVLIAAQCRHVSIDYARLFDYEARNGIDPADLMPLGRQRSAFQSAYRSRARTMPAGVLCADLVDERALAIPGVFLRR